MNLAIISGGSRGLGRALCERYTEQGWRVLEFSRAAPHPYSVSVDLADPAAAQRVFAGQLAPLAAARWTRIVAIANAGVLDPIGPSAQKDPAQVLANLSVNIASTVMFLGEVVRAFQGHACDKQVINISSGAALNAYPGWSLYCASKAATEMYVRAVALEQALQPHPLRVLSVSPGLIDTAMQATIRASTPADFPAVDKFVERHRNGELRPPEVVAAAVQRIADDASLAPGSRVTIEGHLAG